MHLRRLYQPESELPHKPHTHRLLQLVRWALNVLDLQADTQRPRIVIEGIAAVYHAEPPPAPQRVLHEPPLQVRPQLHLRRAVRQAGRLQATQPQEGQQGRIGPGPGASGLAAPRLVGLALAREELRAELLAGEREADEARRREAGGAGAGANASLLPLLRLGGLEAPCLPHCTAEVELRTDLERGLVEYALRGGRRLGVIDGSDAFDDDARPLGVCLEIQDIERPPHQLQQPVRVRLVGKFRFWLVEPPEVHEEGFELGRVEAFFDEALSPADLALSRGEAEPPDADGVERLLPAPEVARAALELLECQLVQVGHAGRRVFGGKFGEVPVLRTDGATTSASMERLSFWLLGVLLVDLSERRQWLACVDTRARLESCRERLAAAGTRPVLDLPGARSWMNPGQSALSSFALLLAIVAVLVAKAMGLFERGFRGYMNDEGLQDTVMFGQLLR
mmetsp:Transcript_126013/g.306157  ORF Transcript_126013/g.306157 Transcript_126013/m.306157 type:complete len:451 (-) Transcript_126013:64-1416(-)